PQLDAPLRPRRAAGATAGDVGRRGGCYRRTIGSGARQRIARRGLPRAGTVGELPQVDGPAGAATAWLRNGTTLSYRVPPPSPRRHTKCTRGRASPDCEATHVGTQSRTPTPIVPGGSSGEQARPRTRPQQRRHAASPGTGERGRDRDPDF